MAAVVAATSAVPKPVLDSFWALASEDPSARASASAKLVHVVASAAGASESGEAGVDLYVVQRLVRGVASSAAAARRGFMLALAALPVSPAVILKTLHELKADPHPLRPLLVLECVMSRLECKKEVDAEFVPTSKDLTVACRIISSALSKNPSDTMFAPYLCLVSEILCNVCARR